MRGGASACESAGSGNCWRIGPGRRTFVEMDGAQTSSGCSNSQSWGRAGAFAIVSAAIGTFGHAFALGAAPSYGVLVAAAALLTLYARCFSSQRVGARAMLVAVTVAQLLVHAVLRLPQPTVGHMHHNALAHQAMVHTGAPVSLMLLVHAAAILAGVGVLLRVEQATWTHARAGITRLARFVTRLWHARRVTRPAVQHAAWSIVTTDAPTPRSRISSSQRRRGPPRIATTLRA